MAQKPQHLFLLLAITLSISLAILSGASADGQSSSNADIVGIGVESGAWQVVQNPQQDPLVQQIIQFVLANQQLQVQKIIRVEQDNNAPAGRIVKRVVISATGISGVTKTCEAVVSVNPGMNNYMKLTSFRIMA